MNTQVSQSPLLGVLQRKKGILTVLVILICLFFVGFVVYLKKNEARAAHALELMGRYENDSFEKYVEKKLSAGDLEKKFQELMKRSKGHRFVFPLMMKTARELSKNKEYSMALKVLLAGQEKFSRKNQTMSYFISLDLAVLYEELDDVDKAISVLEEIDRSVVAVLKDKIYLDLGRLYYRSGDKEKARLSLNRLLAHSKENQFIDLARIYLHLLNSR